MDHPIATQEWLELQIRKMSPWHHDIQITENFSTGKVFSGQGRLDRKKNNGVSLISPRKWFIQCINKLYPKGLTDLRFLDCACNAGIYCFLVRESGAKFSFGFDMREHWIDQAKFIQQYRTLSPTDRIEFRKLDLFDLPAQNLAPFDFTLFNGIFYHLPDPIHGLKLVADLTRDVIIVNTATLYDVDNPGGLTPRRRSADKNSENVMSGGYSLAWFPNGPEAINEILRWTGFKDVMIVRRVQKNENRGRIVIIAAKEAGRLDKLKGERLT